MPPTWPVAPKWMWACETVATRSAYVSVYSMPASVTFARNEPVPEVESASGASWSPLRCSWMATATRVIAAVGDHLRHRGAHRGGTARDQAQHDGGDAEPRRPIARTSTSCPWRTSDPRQLLRPTPCALPGRERHCTFGHGLTPERRRTVSG